MEITKHPRFRWMAGMLTTTGRRVLSVYVADNDPKRTFVSSASLSHECAITTCSRNEFMRDHGSLDLTDAATVGCLYETLHGAVGSAGLIDIIDETRVRVGYNLEPSHGTNLGEALCVALLTVWGEK